MKIKEVIKKVGENSAVRSIDPRSYPRFFHQPKPPAKIQELISKDK